MAADKIEVLHGGSRIAALRKLHEDRYLGPKADAAIRVIDPDGSK